MNAINEERLKYETLEVAYRNLINEIAGSITSFMTSLTTYCRNCPELQTTERENVEKDKGEEKIPCYDCVIQKICHNTQLALRLIEKELQFKTTS